jgi:hypothetical protein
MFPGTSRQTPREPDLGSPYRVDLGTAGNKDKKEAKAVARKEIHRGNKTEIDAMRKKYEAAVQRHEIAVKTVEAAQVELDKYGDLLKQLESAHEHSVSAEKERTEAEEVKRTKANEANLANLEYKKMKEELHKMKTLNKP